MLGERDGVVRRLRAAVDGDLQRAAAGLDEGSGNLAPFLRREEDTLARRAEHEHAVDSVPGEEVDVRPDRAVVEGAVRSGVTAAASAPRNMAEL